MSGFQLPANGSTAQGLTDAQVESRLAIYNPDGRFGKELKILWDRAGPSLEEAARAYGGDEAAARLRDHFIRSVNAEWIHAGAAYGMDIYNRDLSVPTVIHEGARYTAILAGALHEHFADDNQGFIAAMETLQRLRDYGTEVVLAQIGILDAHDAAEKRGRQSEHFEQKVASLVAATTEESVSLRDKTGSTAAAARGMLGKSSEVASAAEQSALAMREAAHTAAGLILAIEEAREQVEVAAGVAARAGEQAAQAVEISGALSSHVETIESILSLIRDIAGQTNLLALNA
ncbi:chemotaxis protein, partial [Sphingosinicella sp. GR2756]|nr:chemotaxis protein [Sphingosinicella sp. GR2756]